MIKYLKGDATYPQGEGNKIIAHVCNDQGGWGRGFVLAVSKRWKEPEKTYRHLFQNGYAYLGQVQSVKVEPDIWVMNMFAQRGYKTTNNPVPLSYIALEECLTTVCASSVSLKATVHMPRIGAGLGGADWSRIEAIINDIFRDVDVFVYDFQPR